MNSTIINHEKEYQKKNILEKGTNIIRTIYNTNKFYCKIIPNLFHSDPNLIYPNDKDEYNKILWKTNSFGLIVCIHGLLGSPKTFGYKISYQGAKVD